MASESDSEMSGLNGKGVDAKIDAPHAASSIAQPARRRAMLRTLGAASPVVLTLVSNPVSACTCVVASSYVSALTMASRKPTSAQTCAGLTPSGWSATGATWPQGYNRAKLFKDVFIDMGGSITSTTTLLGALSGANGSLAQYCVAALLNAKSGKVSNTVLNVAQVIDIWRKTFATGYYQPTPSSTVKFTPAQTVTWLANMMA